MMKLLHLLPFILMFRGHISIRNGYVSQAGAVPYQAAILDGDVYKCGGSLINPRWVLTVASCISDIINPNVVLGATNLDIVEAYSVKSKADNLVKHPNYAKDCSIHDIGLVRLENPVKTSSTIFPVGIAKSDPPVGQVLSLSGYGKTGLFSSSPCLLHQSKVEAMSCSTQFGAQIMAFFTNIDNSHYNNICTRGSFFGPNSACDGDQGSPLVYHAGNGLDPVQVGVVNKPTFGCNGLTATEYTSVARFHNWIIENSGVNSTILGKNTTMRY